MFTRHPPIIAPFVVAAALGWSCVVSPDEFKASTMMPAIELEAVEPPPATTPSNTRLHQLLYAGEHSEAAYVRGQRLRILVWLRSLPLEPDEYASLLVAARKVRAMVEADQQAEAAFEGQELAAVSTIHDELYTKLLTGEDLPEKTLAAYAQRLVEAQDGLYQDEDPAEAHRQRVVAMLVEIKAWMGTIPLSRRQQLGTARFLLNRRAGPLTNPSQYPGLVGMNWDRGDFTALNTTIDQDAQGHLDLGGLWTLEHLRSPPAEYLQQGQVVGLVLLALLEPQFVTVLEDLLTARGALPTVPGPTEP